MKFKKTFWEFQNKKGSVTTADHLDDNSIKRLAISKVLGEKKFKELTDNELKNFMQQVKILQVVGVDKITDTAPYIWHCDLYVKGGGKVAKYKFMVTAQNEAEAKQKAEKEAAKRLGVEKVTISGKIKKAVILSKTQDNKPFRTKYTISYNCYYTAGVKLNNGKYSRSKTEKRGSRVIATSKQEALQKLKNSLKKAERAGFRYSDFKIIKIEREPMFEKLSAEEVLDYLLGKDFR